MGLKGSITPRKMYFLKRSFALLICALVSLQHVESLRTGHKGRSRDGGGDVRSRSGSSSSSARVFMHPTTKQRRLSFLNHHLSMLGGLVGPEPKITSKIYSHLVDSETGTDEISVVEAPPNSDLVVGKEIPKGTRLVLECQAEFPVSWAYKGDGVCFDKLHQK